jgi:hypothetical protein
MVTTLLVLRAPREAPASSRQNRSKNHMDGVALEQIG